jgi:hypothetical protein
MDAPPGPVWLIGHSVEALGSIFDRVKSWAKSRNRKLYLILLLCEDEFLPDNGSGLVSAWCSFGYRMIHFSDSELFADTLSEKMQLLKTVWELKQGNKRDESGIFQSTQILCPTTLLSSVVAAPSPSPPLL